MIIFLRALWRTIIENGVMGNPAAVLPDTGTIKTKAAGCYGQLGNFKAWRCTNTPHMMGKHA